MLYCTGAPKTGTHLLLKALHLFGGDCLQAIHSHKDHNFPWKTTDTRVHIIRNPRNVLISWVRYQHLPRNDETIIGSMNYVISCMLGHYGWIEEEHCLTVRFEELLEDPNVIKKISEHLDKPLIEDHFDSLWGDTDTFTNDLTEWRDFWTDDVNTAWIEKGGVEIENKMCYFNTITELPKKISGYQSTGSHQYINNLKTKEI